MNLLRSQNRINELLAIFVAQVKAYGASQRTDINRVAESVMIPLFREVYGYSHLEDLNRTEGPNFAGIDLGDRQVKVAIQVTSTSTTEKVKHTLEQVVSRELNREYRRVIIYVLTEKQKSYPRAALSKVVGSHFDFSFDPDRDILDYRDLFKEITGLSLAKTLRVEQLLEEHFGQPGPPFWMALSSLPPESVYLQLLIPEVLQYLDGLATDAAELPRYYPDHLRTGESGKTRFDNVRQMVQVVEDRSAFERWQAEVMERMRATGQGFDLITYKPARALPEAEGHDEARGGRLTPPSPVPWDERAGDRFKRAVILGDPGFGKTWLLHYEARRLAVDAARRLREQAGNLDELILPIFARLPDVNQSDDPLEKALIALVGARVEAGGSDALRRFVREKMESGRCVILLDALDEVPVESPADGQSIRLRPHHRQRLLRRLADFARQFPRPRLLLTSRIVGYDPAQLSIPNLQELELLAFDVPQIESFVSTWFGDDERAANQCLAMLRQVPQVRGLGRIPLMLTLLCRTFLECEEKQCEFPTHRTELYDYCLRGLLRDWKSEKDQREISDAYVDAVFELLHTLSFTLLVEGHEHFGESILRQHITPWLDGLKSSHELCGRNAASIIAELKREGVLITAGEHRGAPLLFLHRTFHEYLTAGTLGKLVNDKGWRAKIESQGKRLTVRQLVEKKAWDPAWQEVIVLLAGLLQNPAPLLKLLADRKGDDLFRHRLTLAVLCLPEIKPRYRTWRLSRLVDKITTDAFRLWWDHHTPNISKNVAPVPALLDHALPALGQANGRVNGQPLLELICRYLRSEENEEQAAAVNIIGKIGSVATTADPDFLDRLTRILQTVDQSAAIHAITSLGSAAATLPVIAELVRMLEDEEREEWTCVMAGNALGQMPLDINSGTRAIILDRLAQVIQDPNSSVWYEITENVRRILGLGREWDTYLDRVGKSRTKAEALARLLEDVLRWKGYEGEAEAGEDPDAVRATTVLFNDFFPITLDELALKLERHDWSERSRAIHAVCKNGDQAARDDILDRLVEILQRPASGVAVTPVTLEQLNFKMRNPHWGMEEFNPAMLLDALSNRLPMYKAWSVAMTAVSSTGVVTRIAPQAPPDPLNRLSRRLGGEAVFAEEHFGDMNRLARMLQESGPSVYGDEAGRIIFTQLRVLGLLSPQLFERSAAVMAIRVLRDAAAERPDILDRLSQMLTDRHHEVWSAAAMAIQGIGGDAATQPILRQVAQMLESDDWLKRHAATIMLMGIGRELADTPPILESVLRRLERMLAHPNWLERYAALTAVASIGSAATRPEIIGLLVKMLRDEIPSVRSAAAGALGLMKQSGVYFFVTRDGIKIKGVPELAAV